MPITPEVVAAAIAIAGSGGAAWTGVRVALNGTRERVVKIEQRQEHMETRVFTKLDSIQQSVTRLETIKELESK